MSTTITTADQWADALDAELAAEYGGRVSDQISFGYAHGSAAGISLNAEHDEADDERGVIVSSDGRWVASWDPRSQLWGGRDT